MTIRFTILFFVATMVAINIAAAYLGGLLRTPRQWLRFIADIGMMTAAAIVFAALLSWGLTGGTWP